MDDDGDLGRELDDLMRSLEPLHGHSVARRWYVPSRFAGALILSLVLAVRGWGQSTDPRVSTKREMVRRPRVSQRNKAVGNIRRTTTNRTCHSL